MRYLFLLFTLLFAVTPKHYSQWSTDPNNNLIIGYGQDPKICSDSAGGCYITYNADISYPRKLVLERINKYGYQSWNTNKEITGELPEQWQAEIIEDGQGGVIVGYEDNEWIPPFLKSRVRVQKIDSSGNLLWGQLGIRVSLQEIDQGNIRIVNDGNGGCIVVWNQELSDYTYEYRANRINHLGERTWSDSGIFIVNSGSSEPASIVKSIDGNYYVQYSNIYRINQYGQILNQYYGNMLGQPVPDSEGGIILSGRVWTGMIPKLVAQRKDSLGNNLWQEPYVEIADSLDINTLLNIKYNNGYYYYSWTGKKNGIDKIAQFQALRLDGSSLFTQGSISLSNHSNIGAAKIIPSETNRTIFVWNDATVLSSTIAQIYDTLGNKIWNENGIIVSYPAIAYQTITDCRGGFITQGPIDQFTIIAQQVSKDGILGQVIIPVELLSFSASLINNKVELKWQTATELNNQGFQIERRVMLDERSIEWMNIGFINGSGTTTAPQSYTFIDEKVSAGIYQYRLKQIDFDGSFEYSDEIEIHAGIAPKEFILEQNYPNPFNSSTIIKYQIPTEGGVQINLYNILGEKILTLLEGEREKGIYSFAFSSSELPSGNYFYSLESNSSRVVKKLTILK